MPGRRSRLNESDDEDFEILADQTPPTKRARSSKFVDDEAAHDAEEEEEAAAKDEVVDEDAADEDDEMEGEEGPDVTPATQYASSTTCAEAGTIESIELVDFMCHAHFKIELGPNLNFVVGLNGSGKSAVLTAITVCLGGKAAASGRGTSVKSLVRDGASQATIVIVMRNKGDDAYQPKQYGEKIIVERKFKADGQGSYALKSVSGHKNGSRREDLEMLCDHFGLQIDNPMNILSQDFAREFLANSTPKTLYSLFMKGIDMSQLEADHNLLHDQIATTTTILESREAGVASLKAQVDQAEKMFATTVDARRMNETLDGIKDQMAWAQVVEAERTRDEYTAEVEELRGKVARAEEKIGKSTLQIEVLRTEMEEVQKQCAELNTSEAEPLQARKELIAKEMQAGKDELQKLQAETRSLMEQIKRAKQEEKSCRRLVEVEREALATNEAGILIQELERKRETIQSNLADVRNLAAEVAIETDRVERSRDAKAAQQSDANREVDRLKSNLSDRRRNLDQMTRHQGSPWAAYPANMEKLVNGINRQSWKQKPIGPFGSTMKLKYPEWSDIVEKAFGSTLNSFYVKHFEDKVKLQRMMKEIHCFSSIVYSQDDDEFHYDEPDPQYLTMARAIEWSNPSVKRRFLISHRIANDLLIKHRPDADALMRPQNKPTHANRAYALHPSGRGGYLVGGGAAGSSSSAPMDPWNGAKRLSTTNTRDIDAAKQEVQRLEQEVIAAEEVARTIRREHHDLSKQMADCEDQRKTLDRKIARATSELNGIAERLETAEAVDDGKLIGLVENLKESEATQATLDLSYKALQNDKAELDAAQLERKQQLNVVNKELEAFTDKLNKLKPRLEELAEEMQKHDTHADHYKHQKRKYEAALTEAETSEREHDTEVQAMVRLAGQMCARVPVHKTTKQLEAELRSKTKILQDLQSKFDGQTVAQIAAELDRAKTAYNNATADIQELHNLADMLRQCLGERVAERERFRKQICARVRINFQMHLNNRGYKGKIKFEHKSHQLIMKVNPTKAAAEAAEAGPALSAGKSKRGKNVAGGNNKGLSGGEKSFTTICLLLSMWDAMNCPIRALDEFDVFMDAVNRTVALSMIRKSTNDSADKQFILITPQDMQGVKEDKMTKIMMLGDPRRAQSNGGMTA